MMNVSNMFVSQAPSVNVKASHIASDIDKLGKKTTIKKHALIQVHNQQLHQIGTHAHAIG